MSTVKRDASIFQGIDKNLLKRFKEFHEKNGFVYQEFYKLSTKMKLNGRKKYSAWTIINKIRWDYDLKTKGDVFKINNDFIALYARLVIYNDPALSDFFSLREMKQYRRVISKEESKRRDEVDA